MIARSSSVEGWEVGMGIRTQAVFLSTVSAIACSGGSSERLGTTNQALLGTAVTGQDSATDIER